MIIDRYDLEKGNFDKIILEQIKRLAKIKMKYNFEQIELKFCIKKIESSEGYC